MITQETNLLEREWDSASQQVENAKTALLTVVWSSTSSAEEFWNAYANYSTVRYEAEQAWAALIESANAKKRQPAPGLGLTLVAQAMVSTLLATMPRPKTEKSVLLEGE